MESKQKKGKRQARPWNLMRLQFEMNDIKLQMNRISHKSVLLGGFYGGAVLASKVEWMCWYGIVGHFQSIN